MPRGWPRRGFRARGFLKSVRETRETGRELGAAGAGSDCAGLRPKEDVSG